jgi:hypothetical protein
MKTNSSAPVASRTMLSLFLKDVELLAALPQRAQHAKLCLYEYPFDHQLLSLSPLYCKSRKHYIELGGQYFPRISSTMRSLSAQDLFKDEIDYTPSLSELIWFKDHVKEVSDPNEEVIALERFNAISVFHEQNHRVIWQLLPPAPNEERDLCRYLNFAESLVVMLDLALGDEIGAKLSPVFERMKVIYRTGRASKWSAESRSSSRRYLLAMLCATYYLLELVNPEDILKAVDFVLPSQKKMNKDAVRRSLAMSELFTRITNPQWQERYWKDARKKLKKIHSKSQEGPLYLPADPLDLEEEFIIGRRVLDHFGL